MNTSASIAAAQSGMSLSTNDSVYGNFTRAYLDLQNTSLVDNTTSPDDHLCTMRVSMWTQAIVRSIFAGFAITGNVLILLSVTIFPRMRTADNILLCNMSLSNCLVCAYIIVHIIQFFQSTLPIDERISDIKIAIYLLLHVSSIYNLALMTLERVISLVFPLRYKTLITKKRVWITIFICWAVYIVYVTIPFYTTGAYILPGVSDSEYHINVFHEITKVVIIVGTTANLVMFLIILYILVRARRRDDRATGRKHGGKQKMKTFTVLAMCVSTLVAWFPALVITLMYTTDLNIKLICFRLGSKTFAITNASFNWIIYGVMRKSFRASFLRLITCQCSKKQELRLTNSSRSAH